MSNLGVSKNFSEATLAAFNTFVRDELPEIIKRNIASGKAGTNVSYYLRQNDADLTGKTAIFEYNSATNHYSFTVMKEEFLKYMTSLCLSGR